MALGGSVVDAMVSTAVCIGVIRSSSSGIGGGGFMIYHEKCVCCTSPPSKNKKLESEAKISMTA